MNQYKIPEGFRFAAMDAGIASGERLDLALAVADTPSPAALVTTTNKVIASCVALNRSHMRSNDGLVRAILVNAGCANACTGEQGDADALRCAEILAGLLDCPVEQILVFSTGVIGKPLPMDRFEAGIPKLHAALSRIPENVEAWAKAILTTDLVTKIQERQIGTGTLLGIAKGSGMIHPNMATMLGFLFGDAELPLELGVLLQAALARSFHLISVDGDTSTNDSLLLWSSAKQNLGDSGDEAAWIEALHDCSRELAKSIVRDGEGAKKLLRVEARGAATGHQAQVAARTIASSLLVRTAVAGEDANWGRILAAAGRSGAEIDTRKAKVGIGEAVLFSDDQPHAAAEAAATEHLRGDEVLLWCDLGCGQESAEYWTCDLTEGYIRINADYRT
ncbi:MAG: bifunctional ornithine acetyltransferase/N-acetylglutamate synthase [Planctomycetota bacterium]|nr:MAG: bifunctional ornithine acetyltransferase/N-acetylglutamate synthase [Planctomycetota bacterium]